MLYILFLLFTRKSYQQDDDDYDDDYDDSPYCSFISGEGCMNGICKFCALCVPSNCILATPYSTGNNDGSTCAVTNQAYGYDFYNYCLSSGTDEDDCGTSTECYPYRQGNNTLLHTWTNLTCDQDTCQLVMNDGSPPPKPVPLDNIPKATSSTGHPTSSNSGHINPHNDRHHGFESNSPAVIALSSISVFVFICLIILLIRILFFKTKYWQNINKYLFCGACSSPRQHDTRPPSFISMITDDEALPSYHRQDPSLPKYEQAIVSQIRGYIGSSSSTSLEQPIWVPVYFSSNSENNRIHVNSPILSSLFSGNAEDWAAPRHRTIASNDEQ